MSRELLRRIRRSAYADAIRVADSLTDRLTLRVDAARDDRRRGVLEIPGEIRGYSCAIVVAGYGGWDPQVAVDVPVLRELHGVGLCPGSEMLAQ